VDEAALQHVIWGEDTLNFLAKRRMLGKHTNLSVWFAVNATGWRRDEWAHSPLFIWGKFLPENGRDFDRELLEIKELTTVIGT
jgi:hypothetical protein